MSAPGDKRSSPVEYYCPSCEGVFDEGLSECPNDGTRLVRLVLFGPAEDELVGRRLDDRFTLGEPIGSGGMGTVYRGLQHSVGREVAIKVINPRHCRDRTVAKRFLREATLASRLSNKTTVTVLDFGQSEEGQLYLVMELLPGRTLKEVIAEDGPLPLPRVINIATQVCEALESAAEIEVVHRDLKPSNIMLVDGPRDRDMVKVLDFGLAKSLIEEDSTTVTQSDALLGTPAYMSPDLAMGGAVDARSDLYSLGVMLYQMVAGVLPFTGTTFELLINQHVIATPPPIDRPLPDDLRATISRLLAKKPADRFQSAADVHDTLRSIDLSGDLPVPPARAPGPTAALAPTLDRRVDSGAPLSSTIAVAATATSARSPRTGPTAPGRSSRRLVLALLGMGTLGIVALFGYRLVVSGEDDGAAVTRADAQVSASAASSADAAQASPADAAQASPADAGAAVPARIEVSFESKPSGAKVTLDGKRLGKTPLSRSFAADGSRRQVVFTRRGYDSQRDTLKLDRGLAVIGIHATLEQRRPPPRRRVDAGSDEDFIDP